MKELSPNFGFLAPRAPLLHDLAGQAERYCLQDPPTALAKLRAFTEVMCELLGGHFACGFAEETDLIDMIRELGRRGVLEYRQREMLHALRKAGNDAAHDNIGTPELAVQNLKYARALAMWYHQVFLGGALPGGYGPFRVPPDPKAASEALKEELEGIRRRALSLETELKERRASQESLLGELDAYREENERQFGEILSAMDLASESEESLQEMKRDYETSLRDLHLDHRVELARVKSGAGDEADLERLRRNALAAAESLELDEADTRALVDAQLREAGWEADSSHLQYGRGTRPAPGRPMAIAEWPVPGENGSHLQTADYVLFDGLTVVGIVEAHRLREDVRAFLYQARRCSRNFDFAEDLCAFAGSPWGQYRVPFLYSTDGRPDNPGIWFCDGRLPELPERLIHAFNSPQEIRKRLL